MVPISRHPLARSLRRAWACLSPLQPLRGFWVVSAGRPAEEALRRPQEEAVRNPHKPGVPFYGVNGPDALPFQGGLLCVSAPIQRTPPQSFGTSGSPPCSGVLALDLISAGICASIGFGHHGWMQG